MQDLEPYFSETPGFFAVILIQCEYTYSTNTTCSQMFQHASSVWFSFITPELLCKSCMICTALYHSSGFFIIMSPAEGLHFSALVL